MIMNINLQFEKQCQIMVQKIVEFCRKEVPRIIANLEQLRFANNGAFNGHQDWGINQSGTRDGFINGKPFKTVSQDKGFNKPLVDSGRLRDKLTNADSWNLKSSFSNNTLSMDIPFEESFTDPVYNKLEYEQHNVEYTSSRGNVVRVNKIPARKFRDITSQDIRWITDRLEESIVKNFARQQRQEFGVTSLTQALPQLLTKGIYNQLQFLFIEYCKYINVWTRQIFGDAQYNYLKGDLASVQRPSIFVYPVNARKDSWTRSYTGIIRVEFHFNLQDYRTELAEHIIQIANDIELINLNLEFQRYMQPRMPGLFWFGKYCETDYTQVYQQESVINMKFDFNVDLLAYKRGLIALGRDITSPDEQIYFPVEDLLENLAILRPDQTVAFVTN